MKCEYLSDLRFLTHGQRQYPAQALERLTPRQEDILERNDVLNYLTGAPPENTPKDANAQLIQRFTIPPFALLVRDRADCKQRPAEPAKYEG